MTRDKPLTINADSEKSILQLSPSLPIFSSQRSSWNGIRIGYYQHPTAFETPEHCFSQHFITIHLNHVAVVKEQNLDGCLRRDRFRDCDICLTPATAPVSVRLQDLSEIISLYLEPTLMTRITAEVAQMVQMSPYYFSRLFK